MFVCHGTKGRLCEPFCIQGYMSRKVQIKHKAVTLECSFLQNSHLYKPWKKKSLHLKSWFLFCVGSVSPSELSTFWYLSAQGSLQRLHKQATDRSVFPTGMFEDGLLVGDQLPRHSPASLTCQVPPAGYASISCPGWRGGARLSNPGAPVWECSLQRAMTSSVTHPALLPRSSQPVPQRIGPERLQSWASSVGQALWVSHTHTWWAPRWISTLVTSCRTIKITKPVQLQKAKQQKYLHFREAKSQESQ